MRDLVSWNLEIQPQTQTIYQKRMLELHYLVAFHV